MHVDGYNHETYRAFRLNVASHNLNVISLRLFCLVESHGLISGFPGDVDENCGLMGYYTACDGNSLPIDCPEASVSLLIRKD